MKQEKEPTVVRNNKFQTMEMMQSRQTREDAAIILKTSCFVGQ